MSELARRIEMDQGLLSKIERGKRPPPQLVPHVQRIGAALSMESDSAEFKELVETAYKERFPKEKWPAIVGMIAGEGGLLELGGTPLRRSGLGALETLEISQARAPVSAIVTAGSPYLGPAPDSTFAPRDFSPPPVSNIQRPTTRGEAKIFLCSLYVTDVERDGENFLIHARNLTSDKKYEVRVRLLGESREDK
jgi:hypothetical protein